MANNLDTFGGFDGLGVEILDGVPVVTDQDDEADTPHDIDETPEEDEQDDNDDDNEYARELSVPSMEGYPFQQPALDTVIREMFENLQLRCSDMRAPVGSAFVEMESLMIRTIHAGLLTQMDQLEEIIGPINEEHTNVHTYKWCKSIDGSLCLVYVQICQERYMVQYIPKEPR